ncbi:MAG TPA: hypothetical protein DCP92_19360 [Nitrospiraceae bacterium]|nr:hypothetical protein [Nitrospiraceae bacterium]
MGIESNNRRSYTLRLQRIHRSVANIRGDWRLKTTSRLCRGIQAVGIKDLCIAGMLKHERPVSHCHQLTVSAL